MNEKEYAKLDNVIMDEINVTTLFKLIPELSEKNKLISLAIDKGSDEYYFTKNGDKLDDESQLELKPFILNILKNYKGYSQKNLEDNGLI